MLRSDARETARASRLFLGNRFAVLSAMLATSLACGGGGGGGLPAPLAQTLAVDGSFDFAALGGTQQALLEFVDGLGSGAATGKLTTLRWFTTNDDRHLYVALQWNDATHDNAFDATAGPTDFDGVKLAWDEDGDGVFEQDEDACTVLAATVGSQFVDQHADPVDETDAIGDGRAALRWDPATELYSAEFLLPLADDANGEDGGPASGGRWTILLMDHVQIGMGTGNGVALHGVIPLIGADASGWDDFALSPAGPHAHPVPPDDLTGLIAFISTHENPRGDVYTYDPATDVIFRVTNDAMLFKDNCSLSHDRTRIAWHATPDPADGSLYEVWVADADGTDLMQLTSNAILDGHPAWSPDDSRIAYASFRDAKSSLVLMQPDGTELVDLTLPAFDDNDPDWLPDGRIVFKTDRWSTLPEVRIGVMDDDGTNIVQLTAVGSVSDHDPVSDGTRAIFERFPKPTNFATDVESGFVAWDLVEARVDGSGETTLLSDGWLNWLPVYDPSGRYVLYQKNLGYTEARLMTRTGTDLGRLIPGMTRLKYIDWK